MKNKKQIPEALRKQLSKAGKKGWRAKLEKANLIKGRRTGVIQELKTK